ncbi:hypothetical protein E6W39_10865 [Kitasatospora acidiphila]|uniref:Bulb-type lectin domain-containing protein n=1 Tax=Kitasatospora acidiphila TaxID=2567942 RepID=A0A540W0Y0_9ACTN|nr:hypothetical protein [Kitasatospora acidiphila]TQF02668.1 hypothetical protein E6W39_10865 [Kitasatospora acidiphila]
MWNKVAHTGRGLRRAVGLTMAGALAVVGVLATSGTAQAAIAPSPRNTIMNNQELDQGWWLYSDDGNTELIMQSDGNLVLYTTQDGWASSRVAWNSSTVGCGSRAVMQTDGNFVVYSAGNGVCWASGTQNNYISKGLTVENGGHMTIWASYQIVQENGVVGYSIFPLQQLG